MFGQDLTKLNNQGVRIIDIFLLQRTKNFVQINKTFDLTNFELSDGICFKRSNSKCTLDQKNLLELVKVRIVGSSN